MIHAPHIFATSLALAALVASCGEEPPQGPPPAHQFTLEVRVDDSNENPLPRVPVLLDGKPVGLTDAEGKFSGVLTERAGATVTLSVGDLDGYTFPGGQTTEITETLRLTKVGNQETGLPVFLRVQAESQRKDYFVWVRAKCDETISEGCNDLPVTLNGEEVARTNDLGYAHFSFSDVPQSDVEIVIDTPSHSPSDEDSVMYEPRDPSFKLALDLTSHVYLIDETFSDPEAVKAKPKKTTRRKTTRKNTRKKTNTKKTQKKKVEKPKDDGTIQLW